MAEFHTYDPLAEQNQQAVPNGFPRGTPGGFYGNIWREGAAAMRRFHDDISGRLKATGSNGNYVVATSRAIDLARGASIKFRVNHENPAAGPTLSGRPLTYADGSTIPAGAIKNGQLCDAAWDNDNSRWTLSLMPAGTVTSGGGTGTVTGSNLSLTGQVVGSTAVYANGGWIATAAGTVNQFLRGGPNPSFVTPTGMCLLACRITPNPTITVKQGLAHSATVSRTGDGRYSLAVTPELPATAIASVSLGVPDNSATRVLLRSMTTTEIRVVRVAGESDYYDLATGQWIDVLVF